MWSKVEHGQVSKSATPHAWMAPQKKPGSKITNESFEDAPTHKPVSTDEHPAS